MKIVIGEGRLKLSAKQATDGVIFYRVLAPNLRRIMQHKKRDLSVVGTWVAYEDIIVWFKKGDL